MGIDRKISVMPYSEFDLKTVRERFGLVLREDMHLFAKISEVEVPNRLREFLDGWSPAALAMNTEKARSEMIIAPILMEAVRLSGHRLNLFSGISLDGDKDHGLIRTCDYLLSRLPERFYLCHPVAVVIEAKSEDIPSGLGHCVAAMLGAKIFNEREGGSETTHDLRRGDHGKYLAFPSVGRFRGLD